jgi:hypothetical protein
MPIDNAALYIELKVEAENGGVYVHSAQVPGLHLMGKCFQDMKGALERAITRLFRDNEGKSVSVIWLTSAGDAMPEMTDVASHLERIAVYSLPRAAA